MITLRSLAYAILAVLWTVLLCVVCLPLILLPRRFLQRCGRLWVGGLLFLVRHLCRLDYRVLGRDNVGEGAAIIAAKHQSAWDTFIFHALLDDPVYVFKKELLGIPLLGWYIRKTGGIPIDRASRLPALKRVTAGGRRALAEGSQVIVFPEGTRVAPGVERPYLAGIAALYAEGVAPVIPVALNSGLFWGRRRFRKYPGTITIQFLPAVPPGLDRRAFLARLRADIEGTTNRLSAEACQRFPDVAQRFADAPFAAASPPVASPGRSQRSGDKPLNPLSDKAKPRARPGDASVET